MLMQRTSPPGFHQIVEQFAALRREFPEAAVHKLSKVPSPIQPFAAPRPDASVVDFLEHCTLGDMHFRRTFQGRAT